MELTPKDPRLNPKMARQLDTARAAWDARKIDGNTRVMASFDDMLDAFASDCMRFSDIAIGLGVSRERVRQIWRDSFARLFRNGSGRKRWRACTLATLQEQRRHAVPQGLAGEAAKAAIAHGLTVEPITRVQQRTLWVTRRRLKIEGHRCVVGVSNRPNKTASRSLVRYFHFMEDKQRWKHEFRILRCGAPLNCWFVMPRDVFAFWGGARGTHRFLPERPNTYHMNAHLGQTDWIWQYREAWHLLK